MVGLDQEEVDLPLAVNSPAQLIDWLAARGGGYEQAFADPKKLRCAVDKTLHNVNDPLTGAKEIAFFPPVTGG